MNERINKLKQQAVAYVDSVNDGLTTEHYRQIVDLKFAELILLDVHQYVDGLDTAQIISNGILRRYGMEE
jgi:hypothetical protein